VFVLSTNQKGAIAEAAIAAEATKLGIVVSRPNVDARYDLIFDVGHRLIRVQCKSAARKGAVGGVTTRGSWYSPGRGYVRTAYGSDEIDAVAAYCREIDATYLLPIGLVAHQTQVHLRLGAARNGQLAGLHSADEYQLGAIAQLGERVTGSHEGVGSSPTGSIGT
jgi:PD-(D/E)XK nuclease superfamily protein